MLNHEDGPCSERRPDVSADLMRSRFLHRKGKKIGASALFSCFTLGICDKVALDELRARFGTLLSRRTHSS